jgi:hypothetical protein
MAMNDFWFTDGQPEIQLHIIAQINNHSFHFQNHDRFGW